MSLLVRQLFITILHRQKPKRMVKFELLSITHDQDPVRICHGGQTVSDQYHSCLLCRKRVEYLLLDETISLKVDVSCCFVDHDDLSLKEHGPPQTNQLLLSHRE